MNRYPLPQLGFWTAECCEEDLFQITNELLLEEALERYHDSDEMGELMVWPTKEAALAELCPVATPGEKP